MKQSLVAALAAAVLLSLPLSALAMSQGAHKDHGKMEHDGMGMAGEKTPLGSVTVEEVKGKAMLKDISAAMAKMNMELTHHFMVFFTAADGSPLGDGTVALKVTGPDGKTGAPVKLMGMADGFGADILLAQPGEYRFEVGSKLKDGKTRQFTYSYTRP